MTERLPAYGGQALIEGVLMRGSRALAAAMRKPDGEIVIVTEELQGLYQSKLTRIPFLRGLLLLWDALGLGTRYLTISANQQTGEDEKLEGPQLYLTLAISMAAGIGLFFVLPVALGQGVEKLSGMGPWWVNLIEGLLRLVIAIAYIWAIGKMPEVARVFSYHGAEHKTINAFEAHEDLTPATIAKYSLEHPRCGTSFLLSVMLISIIFFLALGPLPPLTRYLSRILLLPVIVMLAYEYMRWTANHLSYAWVRWLIRPNLALQGLTTREPDLDMLEVSLAAFNAMLKLEQKLTGVTVSSNEILRSQEQSQPA